MPIQNDSRRILTRGDLATFRTSFYADAAHTIPLVPLDVALYPAYTIYDTANVAQQSGVGQPEATPGSYKVEYLVPKDATLSNDQVRWRIEWRMVNTDLRQVEFVEEFDVQDVVITASESREQKFITLAQNTYRTNLRLSSTPAEVGLDVYKMADLNQPVVTNAQYGADIQRVTDGDSQVYYYDIQGNLLEPNRMYSMIWKVRYNIQDPYQFVHQALSSVSPMTLVGVTSVRMLVDKFQKRLGVVQAYEDSDIVEYLERGHELVNAVYPTTYFPFGNLPGPFTVFHIMFSAWYALQAQQLLETDLGFNFCVDENTLVPTTHGLLRARQLYEVDNLNYLAARETHGEALETLEAVAALELEEPVQLCEISERISGHPSALRLGSAIGRLNIPERRSYRKGGGSLWDFTNLDGVLDRFGIQSRVLAHDTTTYPAILTPFGYEKPQKVYKFEDRECLKIRNSLGYPVVATHNHPFLTLNLNTFETEWKLASDLQLGDLVAIHPQKCEFQGMADLMDVVEAVNNTAGPNTHGDCELPTTWTPELGRLLGYLVAEADVSEDFAVRFYNTNPEIIQDFKDCLRKSFPGLVVNEKTKMNPGNFTDNDITIVNFASVRARRFLYLLGLGYNTSHNKRIPDRLLTAPRNVVSSFIQAFVEGDGCVSVHERSDKSKLQVVVLCSASETLMVDFQNLLLSYGILSTLSQNANRGVHRVNVSGKHALEFARQIGFRFKGQGFDYNKTTFTSKREAMPELLVAIKKNLRGLLGIDGYGRLPGSDKRHSIGWCHSANGSKNVNWDHIRAWFQDREQTLMELSPEVHARIKLLITTGYLWKPITSIEEAGKRTVIDPSFAGKDGHPLEHAFVSGGIVTHNSGQTVTLDYDHQGQLADIASRWSEFISNSLPALKMSTVRRGSPCGAVAGRAVRYNDLNQYIYRIASFRGDAAGVLGQMTTLGLLW